MKRILHILLLGLAMTTAAEEQMTLEQLLDMSNRMDHKAFLVEALQHDSLLKATSTAEWLKFLRVSDSDSLTIACTPTLYDLVISKRMDYVWGNQRDSLLNEWVRFHEQDSNILARAYTLCQYYPSQQIAHYDKLPDCWERGLLLRRSHESGDPSERLYTKLEDYLSKYPNSPFCSDVRKQLEQILRMEVNTSLPGSFTTADSIRVTYEVANAHWVKFLLTKKNKILDSCVVKVPSTEHIFRKKSLSFSFAPQQPGAYRLVVSLPEDTVWSITEKTIGMRIGNTQEHNFNVTDLCAFSYTERQYDNKRMRHHVVATHALTGEPVKGAWVNGHFRNLKASTFPILRVTNRQGHAQKRLQKKTIHIHTTQKKGKHRSNYVATYTYTINEDRFCANVYPNATIFRPGDTLQLAIVGAYYPEKKQAALHDQYIHLKISNRFSDKPLLDTTLTTDSYGQAYLSFAITPDIKLGQYEIMLSGVNISYNSSYFRVEDYRLPTFSLTFCEENRVVKASDENYTLRGRVMLMSGLPMANQQVTGKIICQGEETPFSCVTDFDGTFSYRVPLSVLDQIKDAYYMTLSAQVTSIDGETHQASQSIDIKEFALPEPIDEAEKKSAWPDNEQLWAPQDSLSYGEDGTVTLLLGLRNENPVYVIATSRSRLISAEWMHLAKGMNWLSFALPTERDDYLDVQFFTTVHGKVYRTTVRADVPLRTELHLVPVSFRDHLTPGAEESWEWQLREQQGNPVQGRLVCTMLDEAVYSCSPFSYSLLPQDARNKYTFSSMIQPISTSRRLRSILPWRSSFSLGELPIFVPYSAPGDSSLLIRAHGDVVDEMVVAGYGATNKIYASGVPGLASSVTVRGLGSIHKTNKEAYEETFGGEISVLGVVEDDVDRIEPSSSNEDVLQQVTMREGDTRLAFFIPCLETDTQGILHYHFTTPLDNTRWRLEGMVWNKTGASSRVQEILTAQRTLMAHITTPRFLREGDKVIVPCMVRNSADTLQHVTIVADLMVPGSQQFIHSERMDTTLCAREEIAVRMPCETTGEMDSILVRLRVIGRDGASDGEQRIVTILPIVQPVKESVSFYLHPGSEALLQLPTLPAGATDAMVIQTYCANPLAYLWSGLPTEVDTTYVTPIRMAHHFYTLSVSNYLAQRYPGYRDVVDTQMLIKALKKFQRPNGGLSWLADGLSRSSSYITMEWLNLMVEMREMGALPNEMERMVERAVHFLDRTYCDQIKADEKWATSLKTPIDYAHYSLYAYVRSYFSDIRYADQAEHYYQLILDDMPKQSNLIMAPYQAICLERAGRHSDALHLINYLRKHSTTSNEQGMYFNNLPAYHYWFSMTDQQATFLRAYAAVDPQTDEVNALRQRLLLNRQTTNWGESSLSAFAAAALLQSGKNWLASAEEWTGNMTGMMVDTLSLEQAIMGVRIASNEERPIWGNLTLQYQAPITEVRPYAQPAMKLVRRYMLVQAETEQEITPQTVLHMGDVVRVDLTLTTDREMDGIVLHDHKPATLEPRSNKSGFSWKQNEQLGSMWEGVLTYNQFRNEEVTIYIEHLPLGTYTHSYECYVTTEGTMVSGLGAAESELAPEFNAHTGIEWFVVEKNK